MKDSPKTLAEKLEGLPPDFNITRIMDEHYGLKRKYWFYWEEAVDAWVPAPDRLENIILDEDDLDAGEDIEIRFRVMEMTDHEFESMKEV